MSTPAIFHIEIPKRSSICVQCKKSFFSGMEFHSLLKEGIEEGIYTRQDYCVFCWEKVSQQMTLEDIRTTWKSKVPAKKAISDLPRQRDARAMYLLKEALLHNYIENVAEAFVLTMYLARKRLIYFRKDLILEDGQEASIYEVAQTEEMLCVRKVPLSTLHIDKIQSELASKFKLET